MAGSPDLEKRRIQPRLKIVLCRKVEKKYSRPGDKDQTVAYERALEDATRDVVLEAEDFFAIAEEIRENEQKTGKSLDKIKGRGRVSK